MGRIRLAVATSLLGVCRVWAQAGEGAAISVERAAEAPEPVGPVLGGMVNQTVSAVAEFVDARVGAWGSQQIAGIEVWRYAALLALLLITFVAARLARWFFQEYAIRAASRTKWEVDDLVLERAAEPASVFIQAIGVYWAVMCVLVGHSPLRLQDYFGRVCLTVAAGAFIWYLYRLVGVADHYLRKLAARTDNDLDDTFVDVLRKTFRASVLAVGAMYVGKNLFHWDITALLASAGIVGVAVAFAAQDTIANFFGTLMLLTDRPFKVGERVKMAGEDGSVESIGFRSTRLRTLAGHQVSIPNKTAANAVVENVGRRPHIKRVSNITITYDTPVAKVERALEIVRNILANHRGMDPEFPPRVHFNEFNDWSLNLQMVAWYHPGEHWEYLEWCEEINLEIMRQFEAEGIEFAFPTSTTYLAHDEKRPLTVAVDGDGKRPDGDLPAA